MGEIVLLVFLAVLWLVIVRSRRRQLPLPPGPKPWPLIGNILDMPTSDPCSRYREWCETYNSDIVYFQLPMRSFVVLGSVNAAMDLLDKRSQLYSDRATSVMLELMTWDFIFGFMPYSPQWRAHRRMFHSHFHRGVVDRYRPTQLRQVRASLTWFLKTPEDSRKHISLLIASILFFVAYGRKISSMDDEVVTSAEIAVEGGVQTTIPGAFWIEFFPLLKHIPSWVPGTGAKKFAEKYLPVVEFMREQPYLDLKMAMTNGTATPSVGATLIEEIDVQFAPNTEEAEFHEEVAKNVLGATYIVGAETTASTCETFLLAMAMFPDVQKKAQVELDRVVGPGRLPEFEDMNALPYIRAVMMETMRWIPVVPFGVPHRVTADDIYDGYRIPKGSTIIPNAWAMLHNPHDYPDPHLFIPERFVGKNGWIDLTVLDPSVIAFGFGRRACPGKHFSRNTLMMFFATLLHVFDITAGVDSTGKPVELNTETTSGIVTRPKNIPCGLKPRSSTAERLIVDCASEAS